MLYLSAYLERNRRSYYHALQAIHETGDAIPWVELSRVLSEGEPGLRGQRRYVARELMDAVAGDA